MDLYRVAAVALVVAGHWLAASVAFRDGQFVRENPLVELPWTQWLTWIFQTVPVLFLVAGYASAASWTRRTGALYESWLRTRFRAVLGPTTAYVIAILGGVAVAVLSGVDRSALALSAWSVAMHLWFIPVYLALVALTPAAVVVHRRLGLLAPAMLSVALIVVDVVRLSGWFSALGWVNNLLCWLAIYQIGIAWFFGALRGSRPIVLAAGAGAVVAAAIVLGPYPVSLIGVPGQTLQNSSPPSIVMLAFGLAQAGMLIAVAPTVTRWLRGSVAQRPLGVANKRVMLIYLWHMIAVVLLAVAVYPAGLFPQPVTGTGGWWLSRLLWVAVLSVVTALVQSLVGRGRSVLAGRLPSVSVGLPVDFAAPMLVIGTGVASIALWYFSLFGFAPIGRLPWWPALSYGGGVALAALCPSRIVRVASVGSR